MNKTAQPREFEIWSVEARVGFADYARPCLIVDTKSDAIMVFVFALSTKDYSEPGQSFCIDSSHPDFAATGLRATSFTIHPIQKAHPIDFGRKLGKLTGELLAKFKEWFGI